MNFKSGTVFLFPVGLDPAGFFFFLSAEDLVPSDGNDVPFLNYGTGSPDFLDGMFPIPLFSENLLEIP